MSFGLGLGLGLSPAKRIVLAGSSAYLDGVLASTCCDLDATIAASYTSGQTWANLTATPADGSIQADYDFWRGADGVAATDDPTFTGTAGDPAAYFSFDGGDYFKNSGVNPITINNLHKTFVGNSWWMAMTMRIPGTSTFYPYSDGSAFGNADGFGLLIQTNSRIFYTQKGNSLSASGAIDAGAGTFPVNVDVLHILSFDLDTNSLTQRINSVIPTQTVIPNFKASTTNPAFKLHLGVRNDLTNFMSAGARMYSFAVGNEFLTDTKAQALITHLNARHGRIYA